MDNLSPGARATLLALRDQPGNVHEISQRTGRSRSGTDKALRELAKANLIAKLDGGDPADGAPARWQHTDQGGAAAAELDPTPQPPADPPPGTDADVPEATDEAAPSGEPGEQPAAEPPAGAAGPDDPVGPDSESPTEPATGEEAAEADQPKICRSCGEQLPRICPHCWQKTPSYCGTCRKDMPQARRGEPGEPTILPSGLPRLRPGELEQLVLKVLQDQPLPNHVGISGWTAQRVAIYLPGRSTGAIGNALNKLTKSRQVELLGEQPMRYQLTAGSTADRDSASSDTDPDPEVPADAAPDQPPTDGG